MQLVQSPVMFDEVEHRYTLGDQELSGITSIIHRYCFPDMYSGVSQSVLEKAAERGKRIHTMAQMYVLHILPEENYTELRPFLDATQGIEWVASEYLVSDCRSVASAIDLVGLVDGSLYLYDIKTTSVLNLEYLQWQLSIYQYLFQKQNPDLQVAGLRAIHFRDGKCTLTDILPLPTEYVEALLAAYTSGAESFDNPLHHIPDGLEDMLLEYSDIELSLAEIDAARAPYEERKKQLQERIAETLRAENLQTIETGAAKVTLGKDSTRQSFDWKAFASSDTYKQSPDAFNEYVKQTSVKGRLTITLR